ncbi:TonB-dependent receptor [Novosphingobium sp. 1949]|uniref:TonB-dependent receptor n=1 Tax=Novosphingobium organovorum TaxID=2930092 RepID=A0ABT0B8R0_9SPHN|nr:TonB-dependent receptor [Novosphingobium organovorum]MCJ2181460.1 TonB-dependent receptor [Novosphingobium organovorum]
MTTNFRFAATSALALAAITATVAVPAMADEAADTTTDATTDTGDSAIVVTASRIKLAPREVGSAYTIVTDKELQAKQVTFLKEALQDVPGVQISSDRPGDATSISIRGSDNDEVVWLIDGIQLGDPSATSTQFASDHLTSQDIARVEVLRGNQSSLYGADAIGGVVNIITQRATHEGLALNAEAETGSYGTLNGGASLLGKYGPLDFRLTATGNSHEGPSLADPRTASTAGSITEDDEYWRYGFSGRTGLALSDTISLQALGFWQKAFSDLDGTTSDSSNTVLKREYAAALQGRYASLDGRFTADASVNRYQAKRLYFGTYYSDDGDLYRGTKDAANLNLGYDAGIFAISAGGKLEEEKSDQVTYYSGDLHKHVTTRSGYGELALRPFEGLTLTGAARVDDNSRFGTFDTYRGTIAYALPTGLLGADSIKLRASYGTGAKAPGLYQLFDPTYGNPDLKVQTSKGGDLGVDVVYGWASAQVSYFYTHTHNEIVYDSGIGTYGGYTQYGRTRKDGFEIALALAPATWLRLDQNFTFLTAEEDDDEDGTYTDMGNPKRSGSTAVTVLPVESVSLTARARYRSRNASSYGGTTAAYAVADVLASWRVAPQFELYGRVTNLFDKWYQMSYGKNALGRAVYAGVRYSF